MISARNKLRLAILAAAALLLGGGCSVYDKDTCPEGRSYGKVVMDIVVPSSSPSTKTTTKADPDGPWSDTYRYEDGDEYDNYIDLNTLQILFYRPVGSGEERSLQYVAALQDYDVFPVQRTEEDNYEKEFAYEVVGVLTVADRQSLTPGQYKVVVLANCPKVDAESSLASLQVADFFAGKNQYIPMFGIATNELSFANGEVDNIGKVKLLRSTAKLEMMFNWNQKFRDSHKEIFDAVAAGTIEGIKFKSIELLWGVKAVNCLPTVELAGITDTEEALQEGCYNPASATTVNFSGTDAKTFALNADGTKGSIIVPEYTVGTQPVEETDSEEGADATSTPSSAVFRLVIEEPYKEGDEWKTRDLEFFMDPILNTSATPDGPGKFVRNHLYRFKIVYYDRGKLYVKPQISDWINTDPLEYTINMSTNMRLFDSWLYRYDTDNNLTKDNYSDWATSHMVVSGGFVTESSDAEPVAGRPLRSPQIQLRTTGTGTFELTVDNTNFELVEAVKNDIGVVTEYAHGSAISIAAGENVVTYFHIVPKAGATWDDTNKEVKVTLFYNDTALGRQKVPFNYNSLPGYSDDSSEIWAWYFPEEEYNNNEGDKLKMYFQDYYHPLVPTEDQS